MNKNIRTILIFILIGAGVYVFTYLISGLIAGPSRFSWLLRIDFEQPAEFIRALMITEIPYIVLGFLWILRLSNREIKNYEEEKAGMIGALIGVVIINFVLYLVYYLDLLIGDTSSTGSLIFFVFPFFAGFFGAFGYALGHVFYWKTRRKK